MDDGVIICRCEEVTAGEIREAIRSGLRSVDEIKRATRAGMGLCQGRTCRRLVAGLIAQELNIPLSEIIDSSYRPPLRPVEIGILAKED